MSGQSAKRQTAEITGISMSGQSAKRQKTTAMASAGVSAIDSLPPELLETVFGFLDVGSLCTARLVCSHFCTAASRCISSVHLSVMALRSRPETNLNNFPILSRVSVRSFGADDLRMLAQSPVAHAVTHLQAVSYFWPGLRCTRNAAGLPLLPLPNLTSLTVSYAHNRVFSFPQTLRELRLGGSVTHQTANMVTRLTNLTCLRIDIHDTRKTFESVTALTALQRLEICSQLSLIPFIAELTLLTHLHVEGRSSGALLSDAAAMASLTRLHRLVHLGVSAQSRNPDFDARLERQVLSSISRFTGLRSLDLGLCEQPFRSGLETVCMTPLSHLTALRLTSGDLNASFLPRFNLERLQDLSLSRGVELNRDGVVALRRATCLTHLELWMLGMSVGPEDLGTALLPMSRLRALSLGTHDAFHAPYSLEAIGLLTELTSLTLRGQNVTTNACVEACVGLNKLRVLRMEVPFWALSDRITPETFFAIAKLPELRKFTITGNVGYLRGDRTDIVRACLNAERHKKGWPPLELSAWDY